MNCLTSRRQLQWVLGTTAAEEPEPWHTGVVGSGAKRRLPAPRSSANTGNSSPGDGAGRADQVYRAEAKHPGSGDNTVRFAACSHLPGGELHVTPFNRHENLGEGAALAVQVRKERLEMGQLRLHAPPPWGGFLGSPGRTWEMAQVCSALPSDRATCLHAHSQTHGLSGSQSPDPWSLKAGPLTTEKLGRHLL